MEHGAGQPAFDCQVQEGGTCPLCGACGLPGGVSLAAHGNRVPATTFLASGLLQEIAFSQSGTPIASTPLLFGLSIPAPLLASQYAFGDAAILNRREFWERDRI